MPMQQDTVNPLSQFESIYVINLRSRGDRRREMAEQLAAVGLSFDSPQVRLFEAVRPDDAGAFPSVGARGCFMSHLGVLRDAVGKTNVLILEDDLDFAEGIVAPRIPMGWGMFYGGARHAIAPAGLLTLTAPEDVIGCSHFLAISGAVIPRLVTYLEALLSRPAGDPAGGPMHVDGAYARFRADNPDVQTYLATPELGFQRPSRTDIHALRWYDSTPLLRQLVNLARRVRARRRVASR